MSMVLKLWGTQWGLTSLSEADALAKKDKSYHEEVSAELAGHLRTLIRQMTGKRETERNILAVGLGNQDVTPDALGPKVLSNLQMTRHLQGEYGNEFCKKHNFPVLSGIAPGVMAQTGMETAEILKGIIQETRPDFLIVVDALAARSIRRLGTHHPAHRYRDSSGIRCWKPQAEPDKGKPWHSGAGSRSTNGGRGGGYCL